MIDISYRIFDLVASTNSLTKTAEIVHLTPSAVSHLCESWRNGWECSWWSATAMACG